MGSRSRAAQVRKLFRLIKACVQRIWSVAWILVVPPVIPVKAGCRTGWPKLDPGLRRGDERIGRALQEGMNSKAIMDAHDVFRALALALPDAEEKSHFGKADFRVRTKIFAGFSGKGMAYVKLKPEEQEMLCAAEPGVVVAHEGHWGRQGWTFIDHNKADEALLKSALTMAWKGVAPKKLVAGFISPE